MALLTPSEAAERFDVHRNTLTRWAKEGRIRHVLLPSGRMRFYEEDVAEALTVVEAAPTGEGQ